MIYVDSQTLRDALRNLVIIPRSGWYDEEQFQNILFHINKNTLKLVGTNNVLILIYSIPLSSNTQVDDIKFSVRKRLITKNLRSMTSDPFTTITIEKNTISISNVTVPRENNFPNYEKTMSTYLKHKYNPVTFAAKDFFNLLTNALKFLEKKDYPSQVQITVTNDTLTLIPGYYVLFNEYSDSASIPCSSDINITLYFNPEFLSFYLDYIAKNENEVTMWVYKRTYPIVLSTSRTQFTNPLYAVMPLRDPKTIKFRNSI